VYGTFAAFLIFMLRHRTESEYSHLVRQAIVMFLILAAAQYGWNVGAPHIMHVGGFAAGIVLGLLLDPVGTRPPEPEQPKPYESIFNTSP
jgi:membrane associated rhomboid family serine protease